jgi:2-oxoglutarate dehydrogenase E2 component (dihydrolipoamide succinyltransferase)
MLVNLIVPQLGESVVEAAVGEWRKAEGDFVNIGEIIVDLETDKVDLEVGATHAGILTAIRRHTGETVRIGEVLAIINESANPEVPAQKPATPPPAEQKSKQAPLPKPSPEPVPEPISPARSPSAKPPLNGNNDWGRKQPSSPEAEAPRAAAAARVAPAAPPMDAREERIRMSRRRQTIATRLVESMRTAAMVTTFNDVDMSAVMELRRKHQEPFKKRFGVNLGIVSFFIKAAIPALRAFPRLNAEIQGDEMVLKHYFDIGVAIGAPEGLVVPVLRDADAMSFGEIEQAIKEFARKAEAGSLSLKDLRGGTFTLSNGGVFGSLLSTPILNPPQVAILGLHRIEDRPVKVEGELRFRPMMYMALSYDHRIVDGLEAVRFLKAVKERIEDPASLLLNL